MQIIRLNPANILYLQYIQTIVVQTKPLKQKHIQMCTYTNVYKVQHAKHKWHSTMNSYINYDQVKKKSEKHVWVASVWWWLLKLLISECVTRAFSKKWISLNHNAKGNHSIYLQYFEAIIYLPDRDTQKQ
jgi:hypothetical protein